MRAGQQVVTGSKLTRPWSQQ